MSVRPSDNTSCLADLQEQNNTVCVCPSVRPSVLLSVLPSVRPMAQDDWQIYKKKTTLSVRLYVR